MTLPIWMRPPYQPCAVGLAGGSVTLTNVGSSFDAIAASQHLGIALIDFTGYTALEFRVLVNKIGTGTQSWQLWNVTDGAQIALITDAAAAGDNKLLSTSVSGLALSGVKLVRVRASSTTAADDPIYYGGCVLLS
jgi:hypothetical protein